MNKMLWQPKIKGETSGRGQGSREGRGPAEEMTFELLVKDEWD